MHFIFWRNLFPSAFSSETGRRQGLRMRLVLATSLLSKSLDQASFWSITCNSVSKTSSTRWGRTNLLQENKTSRTQKYQDFSKFRSIPTLTSGPHRELSHIFNWLALILFFFFGLEWLTRSCTPWIHEPIRHERILFSFFSWSNLRFYLLTCFTFLKVKVKIMSM